MVLRIPEVTCTFDGFVKEREAAERKRKNEKKKKLKEKKKAPYPNVLSLLVDFHGLGRPGVAETVIPGSVARSLPLELGLLSECNKVISRGT